MPIKCLERSLHTVKGSAHVGGHSWQPDFGALMNEPVKREDREVSGAEAGTQRLSAQPPCDYGETLAFWGVRLA